MLAKLFNGFAHKIEIEPPPHRAPQKKKKKKKKKKKEFESPH